jgi:hypothetical protein
MLILYVPHQKKSFAKYIWRTHSRWQTALVPVVSPSGMTYVNMVSVPAEEHHIHMHTSPLILQVMPTYLMLRGQHCIHYKNVFMCCGSDHKTFPGLYLPWVRGRD